MHSSQSSKSCGGFVFSGFKVLTSVETKPMLPLYLPEPSTRPTALPATRYAPLLNGQLAYVSVDELVCHARPAMAFDTQIGFLSYGDMVSVISAEGKFAYVECPLGKGWVEHVGIRYDQTDIFTHFQHQTFYFSDTTETQKVRKYIHDECGGGQLHVPLQSVEFVLYELKRRNSKVDWGGVRPRAAGTWQKILKGKQGIHSTIEPRTGSIMEYFTATQIGILALVDEVHPDGAIVIRSVGRSLEGEYRSDTLSSAEWRELRPVFISLT